MFQIRNSNERGYFDHGWLKSYHSFSFADYYDENHMQFGNLRVINEDEIAGGMGFNTHPHRNMEIITYVISGALEHKDSMNNHGIIKPNEVQVMSAGSGVFHSEFNNLKNEKTHLLQIWITPNKAGIAPRYDQKSFLNDKPLNLVVSGSGRDGSLMINQDAEIFVGKFKAQEELKFNIKKNRKIWIQMVFGSLNIGEFNLEKGDGIAIVDEDFIALKAQENSEFLLFDLT